MKPAITGYRSYHICPVCGKQFYIPQTTQKWIFKVSRNNRPYMACSYSCTTKARDDKDAVRMEFIQQDRELASSIAEREKEKDIVKREHAVKPEHGFNEYRKKPDHDNAETKEERDMNKDNGKKTLDDLTEALFGQLDVLAHNAPGATIEREVKKSNAMCNLGGKIIDIARIQLEAAKMTSGNSEASVPLMIEGKHE